MHDTDPHNRIHPARFSASVLPGMSLVAAGPVVAAGDQGGGHGHNGGGHAFAVGTPADASEADRTVTVTARDTMKFEPDPVSIEKGTTVRCIVHNAGQLQHSFTLAKPAGHVDGPHGRSYG